PLHKRPSPRRSLTADCKPFIVNELSHAGRIRIAVLSTLARVPEGLLAAPKRVNFDVRLPFFARGTARLSTPSRSGVFSKATDRRVEQFSESVSFDHRLYAHDIRGSIAHAQMLAQVGLLTADEARQIEESLRQIEAEIAAGQMEFRIELEDIHMHIERALIERLGDVGRKLHTARSRNDQV